MFKNFYMAFPDDFRPQFKTWLELIRKDPIFRRYDYLVLTVITTDNDCVWRYNTREWQDICELMGIKMDYRAKDKYTDTCYGEAAVKIMEQTMKIILFRQNLPGWWWVICAIHACWLLNRFPVKSTLANVSPDGDMSRPIEDFTGGWYSRAQINRELSYQVMPGTPLLVHLSLIHI